MDPMGFARELSYAADYYPLGFPLRLCSNSSLVMDAAAASWAAFPPAFSMPQLEIHAVVVEEAAELSQRTPPDYRGREHLLMIVGGNDSAVCDHARGFAFCRLSESTARDTAFTSYYYLEAIALHLLTQLYLTPVHAACVTRQEAGVLLCGDSGAGKTSLAYACLKQDWCYVSDNESWLLRDHPGRLALGNPHRIRFRETAPELFPELRTRQPFLFANGKMSLALEMNSRPDLSRSYQANISHLVFLDRGGKTNIRTMPKEEAFEKLIQGVPIYSTPVRAQHEDSLRRLVTAETVCISYQSLEKGLELLGEVVQQSHASARDASACDAIARDAIARDASARDASACDASARDASARDASACDASARDASARDASARDASARDASARDASARDASARDASARDGSACDASACDASARDASARDASACDASARDASARDASARDASARDASARDGSACDASACDASARDASARDASACDASARDASARDASARDASARDASARDASARDASA